MSDSRHLIRAVGLALGVWVLAETAVAVTLRTEGYDGYWYLSNAWYLAGGEVSYYEDTKAPLMSLLLVPLYWLRRLGAPELVSFIGAHLTATGLTLLTGVLLARVLRGTFSAPVAWAGAFAFLASRTVFRYGAFAMSDIPTTLFILATLEAARRGHRRNGLVARVPFALAGAAAVLSRYPSALVMAVAALWDVAALGVRTRRPADALRRAGAHAVAGAGAIVLVTVAHLLIYLVPHGGAGEAMSAFIAMVKRNMLLGGVSASTGEPWWEYIPMLALSCTVPLTGLMGLGLVTAARRGGSTEALHGAWCVVHLGLISFVSSHKEIRYLLPALPSLFFFALWGLRGLRLLLLRWRPGLDSAALRPWAVAFLLAAGGVTMATEGRMLAQPFFRRPHQARLAAWVEQQAPAPARLYWSGHHYPLVPDHHVFSAYDEFYYLYHVGPHVLEYYNGRRTQLTRSLPAVLVEGVPYPLQLAPALREGDGLLSSVPSLTWTSTLPDPLQPLTYSTVQVWDLEPEAGAGGGGTRVFQAPGDAVSVRLTTGIEQEMRVQGYPGPTEVVARRDGAPPVSLGLLDPSRGAARRGLPAEIDADSIVSLRIVRYLPRAVPDTGRPPSS